MNLMSQTHNFFFLNSSLMNNKRLIKPLLVVRVGPGTNPKYGSHWTESLIATWKKKKKEKRKRNRTQTLTHGTTSNNVILSRHHITVILGGFNFLCCFFLVMFSRDFSSPVTVYLVSSMLSRWKSDRTLTHHSLATNSCYSLTNLERMESWVT